MKLDKEFSYPKMKGSPPPMHGPAYVLAKIMLHISCQKCDFLIGNVKNKAFRRQKWQFLTTWFFFFIKHFQDQTYSSILDFVVSKKKMLLRLFNLLHLSPSLYLSSKKSIPSARTNFQTKTQFHNNLIFKTHFLQQ